MLDRTLAIKSMVAGAMAGQRAIALGKKPSEVKDIQLRAEELAYREGKK